MGASASLIAKGTPEQQAEITAAIETLKGEGVVDEEIEKQLKEKYADLLAAIEAAPAAEGEAPAAEAAPAAEGEAPPAAEAEAAPAAEGEARPAAEAEAAPAEGEAPPAAEAEVAPAEGEAPAAEAAPATE